MVNNQIALFPRLDASWILNLDANSIVVSFIFRNVTSWLSSVPYTHFIRAHTRQRQISMVPTLFFVVVAAFIWYLVLCIYLTLIISDSIRFACIALCFANEKKKRNKNELNVAIHLMAFCNND